MFSFRSHTRTLWSPSFIKELPLQHGVGGEWLTLIPIFTSYSLRKKKLC